MLAFAALYINVPSWWRNLRRNKDISALVWTAMELQQPLILGIYLTKLVPV